MRVPVAGAAEARRQRVALQLSEPSVPGAHGALGPCMVEDLASGAIERRGTAATRIQHAMGPQLTGPKKESVFDLSAL